MQVKINVLIPLFILNWIVSLDHQ